MSIIATRQHYGQVFHFVEIDFSAVYVVLNDVETTVPAQHHIPWFPSRYIVNLFESLT